jgi:hypothetical protein
MGPTPSQSWPGEDSIAFFSFPSALWADAAMKPAKRTMRAKIAAILDIIQDDGFHDINLSESVQPGPA